MHAIILTSECLGLPPHGVRSDMSCITSRVSINTTLMIILMGKCNRHAFIMATIAWCVLSNPQALSVAGMVCDMRISEDLCHLSACTPVGLGSRGISACGPGASWGRPLEGPQACLPHGQDAAVKPSMHNAAEPWPSVLNAARTFPCPA